MADGFEDAPAKEAPAGEAPAKEAGLDTSVAPRVVGSTEVYRGPIFSIRDVQVALAMRDGSSRTIRRQLIAHAPAVFVLPHDTARDRYLIESEYRVGRGAYVPGIPAGMLEEGEDPHAAMLRELSEETGVVPDRYRLLDVSDCYSSEGMTDEHAYVAILDMDSWHEGALHLDAGEYVAHRWVDWEGLRAAGIREAHACIAILAEQIRRMGGPSRDGVSL